MLEQEPGEPLLQPRASAAKALADVVSGNTPDAGWVDAQLARREQGDRSRLRVAEAKKVA